MRVVKARTMPITRGAAIVTKALGFTSTPAKNYEIRSFREARHTIRLRKLFIDSKRGSEEPLGPNGTV